MGRVGKLNFAYGKNRYPGLNKLGRIMQRIPRGLAGTARRGRRRGIEWYGRLPWWLQPFGWWASGGPLWKRQQRQQQVPIPQARFSDASRLIIRYVCRDGHTFNREFRGDKAPGKADFEPTRCEAEDEEHSGHRCHARAQWSTLDYHQERW